MPSKLLKDHWTLLDQLRFRDYQGPLVQAIRAAETPITIAIYGTWRSGKTSLMRMAKEALSSDHCCVWFDAWKYDKEPVLWRAFLQHVLDQLERQCRVPVCGDAALVLPARMPGLHGGTAHADGESERPVPGWGKPS